MTLVQIAERRGTLRGPAEEYSPPDDGFIELHLEEGQRVVQVHWKRAHEYRHRKTVDWYWTVTIESRLE